MRLTTKIVFGIILSIFFISLTFIVGFSFSDRKNYSFMSNIQAIELPQDNVTGIELGAFKTIIIDEIPYEGSHYYIQNNYGSINFDSIPEKGKPDMLFVPESLKDFVVINTSNDTLTIKLNMPELEKKYKSDDHKETDISGMNMYISAAKTDIINRLRLSVNIKNIETDSIKIISNGSIFIDSCKAQFIAPVLKSNHEKFNLTNCNVKRINLDCDHVRNWNIENSNIEEKHITGSGNHNITLHRNESGKIKWFPKNDKAELNIKIPGDTTEIIIQ